MDGTINEDWLENARMIIDSARAIVPADGALDRVRALRFAIESLAPGTCLEGCTLQIDEPAGQAWCLGCSHSVPLAARGEACPRCGSHQLQPTGGTDLRVTELLVEDHAEHPEGT